jgi:hypothetical protein
MDPPAMHRPPFARRRPSITQRAHRRKAATLLAGGRLRYNRAIALQNRPEKAQ